MSVVRCVVTPSIQLEGTKESAIHRSRRPKVTSATGPDEPLDENIPRLFDFRGWQLGGIPAIALFPAV